MNKLTKDQLKKEIANLRSKLLDNDRAIDAETRQVILDTIRSYKKDLAEIDKQERSSSMVISPVTDVPTGKSVVKMTNNSNSRRNIVSSNDMNALVRMNVR